MLLYKTHSWDSVVNWYSDIPTATSIHKLAKAIKESPYSIYLYPVSSMFDIKIYQDPEYDSSGTNECIIIRYDFKSMEFEFENCENAFSKNNWKKKCSVEESFSGFIHVLALKKWFPVTEIERGKWSCDEKA
jgi:hypothetical protein